MAEEVGALVIPGTPGRGSQIARGVAGSKGDWILILHADTQLGEGWVEAVERLMARAAAGDPRAGYFRLRFRAKGVMAGVTVGWANLRSRLLGLPYGDQGLVLPRSLYDEVGGMPDMPLMEDVAMARALRGRLVALDAEAATSAARYEKGGWIRRGARNLWTLMRYLMGADPEALAKAYRR
jgi:hypothetical protein